MDPFALWIGHGLKELITDKNEVQLRLENDISNKLLNADFKEVKMTAEKRVQNAKRVHLKERLNNCKGNSRAT